MYSATAAFISPVTRKSCGMVSPAWSSPIAMPADTTMNSALRMLLAAMIRDRCDGSRALLDQRVQRHDVEAAEQADQHQVGRDAPVPRLAQRTRPARRAPCAESPRLDQPQVDRRTASGRSSRTAPGRAPPCGPTAARTAANRRRCRSRTAPAAASPPSRCRPGCRARSRRTGRGRSRRRTRTRRCPASTARRRGCPARSGGCARSR